MQQRAPKGFAGGSIGARSAHHLLQRQARLDPQHLEPDVRLEV